MKSFSYKILIPLALLLFSFGISAARKLPVGAYITSAKIHVIEDRPEDAVTMLDSLFLYYGPHSQALGLMAQIMVDFVESKTTADAKSPYVTKMIAYFDTLRIACDNKDIKKKYRKNCDKLIEEADSTIVKYWREFYNRGIEQLNSVEEMSSEQKNTSDSDMLAFYTTSIAAKADSSISNMKLAIQLDSTDHRPYVAVGSLYEKQIKYEDAIVWLDRAMAQTEDSSSLLLSIAYNYINLNEYCQAAPFFSKFLIANPSDLSNASNLTICYIRCDMMDSAMSVFEKMLAVDSAYPDALVGLGDFYRQKAGLTMKKASEISGDNPDKAATMREEANEFFDKSAAYYEKLITINPDSIRGHEEYALISFIRGRYKIAAEVYEKLSVMEPDNIEHWISLGDCQLTLQKFKEAVVAYEKVVELDSEKRLIWERLSDLYTEIRASAAKKAEAEKNLKRLSN